MPHGGSRIDDRRTMRYQLETQTILFDGRGAQRGTLQDISIQGMGLRCEEPLFVGQKVEALIMLDPSGRPLRMAGRVAWSCERSCGVRFTAHDPDFATTYFAWNGRLPLGAEPRDMGRVEVQFAG